MGPGAVDKTVSWASSAKGGLLHLPPALLTCDRRSSPAPPSKAFLPTASPPPRFLRTEGALWRQCSRWVRLRKARLLAVLKSH